jgi:hypothetical protein
MFVNRYQINLSTLESGTTATTINIPLTMEYQLVDQGELINRVFVDVETEKAINPIYDYEKVRFIPRDSNNININKIVYSLNLDGSTNYSDIGFTDDDIKFEKESFKNTFINLSFYDSPNQLTQKLVSFTTLFSIINPSDLNIDGTVKPASQIGLTFTVGDPLYNPLGESEGYHLYDYKDELNIGESKDLYMRSSFKNSKTGKEINLMVSSTPKAIDMLVNDLYTKYTLTRTNTGFYYTINDRYLGNDHNNINVPNNVLYNSNNVTVNLYKILAT